MTYSIALRRVRRMTLAILLVAPLPAGCQAGVVSDPTPGPTATTGAPARTSPTVGPAATPSATRNLAEPPPASLAAEGGDPVVGQLGSFTWRNGGSDSPWLPGSPVTVGAAEPLTVAIGGGVPVAGWSARRVPAGTTSGSGAVGVGEGTGSPVAFAAPGRGAWSVQVVVTFAGDIGSATYYWQLTVR